MAKVRVSDLAKKMNIPDKDLVFKLQSLGVQVEDASQALDHEVIVAILTGKKLATRPRNVIMRDEKPQPEKKPGVVVRPPRPIVKTEAKPRRQPAEEVAPQVSPTGPIIPEFVEAAEAEAAEQERVAKETPKPAEPRTRRTAATADVKTPAAAADAVSDADASSTPAAPPQQQPAAPAAAPAAAASDDRRPTGPTGPRARTAPPVRPNYQGQQPVYQQRPAGGTPNQQRPAGGGYGGSQNQGTGAGYQGNRPAGTGTGTGTGYQGNRPAGSGTGYQGNRPAGSGTGSGYQGTRPAGGGYQGTRPAGGGYQGNRPAGGGYQGGGGAGYQGNRPAGGGYQGNRPAGGGQGFRPGGSRPGGMTPPPVPPPSPAMRRKKSESEDDRPEKKKTTGKRGKRSPNVVEDDLQLFGKGPFSATAVLDDDAPEITKRVAVEGEEGDDEEVQRAPSTRRDSRKQVAPVSGRVLEFKRPAGKVTLSEGVTVKELADKLGVKANDLMKHLLMKKGMMLSINAPLGADLALDIAKDLDIEAELVSFETALELESLEKISATSTGSVSRGPVITVMGHVDHGKTSLLDAIRETNVAGGEAGGITQHIGAYTVEKRGRRIVFLDTPGHEAFTMMRARGAKVTDVVILVVAADDGVMPQTKEAIDHARAAKVPMIVAINKIDKPNANVERVRRELSDAGVLVEQWGGDVVSVEVSAIKKQGIDDLLEMILLTADILDLKATPELPARGVVLEARKDVGRGTVATVLIQDGTLKIGDAFFSGTATGRVRAMTDDRGQRIEEAPPASPVSVMGFDDMPNAGDTFLVVDEEAQARVITEQRQQKAREQLQQKSRMSLDQLFQKMQTGSVKELNLIVKADVQGSVEVLGETLRKLSTDQVKLNVLHSSVGAISTNDVLLASASDAIVVGFNVRPERSATELAEKEGVEIRLHTVIYNLIDEIKLAMTGLLDPTLHEVFQGRAEVRNTFKVPKVGTIAGCHVTEGVIPRTAGVRLLRDNRVIFEGKISSLKHFKNDVAEVRQGFECGIGIERFQDIKVGDIIESFKIEKKAGVLA